MDSSTPGNPEQTQTRVLDQVRSSVRHYYCPIGEAYVQWIKRFIFFQNKRHHLSETILQKAIRNAGRKIHKVISTPTLATPL